MTPPPLAMARALVEVADIRSQLDDALATFAEMMKTPASQYSFQDRQVIYEQRRSMRREISALKRQLALADPDVNALGGNQVDFASFRASET